MAALHEYPEVRSIKAMGGATKSKLWMDILAALCGCDLMIMSEKDTPCVGAALIAAAGEGCDYNSLVQKAASSALHPPASGEAKAFYQEKFARYRAMQNTLYGAGDNA